LALQRGQFTVAQGPLVVDEGDLVSPAGIARDQVLGKVEGAAGFDSGWDCFHALPLDFIEVMAIN
jgi:hypothetical protein